MFSKCIRLIFLFVIINLLKASIQTKKPLSTLKKNDEDAAKKSESPNRGEQKVNSEIEKNAIKRDSQANSADSNHNSKDSLNILEQSSSNEPEAPNTPILPDIPGVKLTGESKEESKNTIDSNIKSFIKPLAPDALIHSEKESSVPELNSHQQSKLVVEPSNNNDLNKPELSQNLPHQNDNNKDKTDNQNTTPKPTDETDPNVKPSDSSSKLESGQNIAPDEKQTAIQDEIPQKNENIGSLSEEISTSINPDGKENNTHSQISDLDFQSPDNKITNDSTKEGPDPSLTDSKEKEQSKLTSEDTEQMPTFTEYQKMLAEETKKKGQALKSALHVDNSMDKTDLLAGQKPAPFRGPLSSHSGNVMQNNIAAYECGGKVVESHENAINPSYVLNSNKDEYMNQRCSSEKWFVIETCEPVQPRIIQIANYELFSSRLKTFNVYSSDRYPAKKWYSLGSFIARDEKGVQSFEAIDDKYVKYFKFEFLDHYGNEHYCPLSMVRIFGTVDEIDEELHDVRSHQEVESSSANNAQETKSVENQKQPDGKVKSDDSPGFLKQATNIIVNMVKSSLRENQSAGAETDSKAGDNMSNSQLCNKDFDLLYRSVSTSSYSFYLEHCLQKLHRYYLNHKFPLFNSLYKNLSSILTFSPLAAFSPCQKFCHNANISTSQLTRLYLAYNNITQESTRQLPSLYKIDYLTKGHVPTLQTTDTFISHRDRTDFSQPEYKKVMFRPSSSDRSKPIDLSKPENAETIQASKIYEESSAIKAEDNSLNTNFPESPQSLSELSKETDVKDVKAADKNVKHSNSKITLEAESSKEKVSVDSVPTESVKTESELKTDQEMEAMKLEPDKEVLHESAGEKLERPSVNDFKSDSSLPDPSLQGENFGGSAESNMENMETPPGSNGVAHSGGGFGNGGRKDTIYMRLSNKMKAIELNVTVSMKYLEELSQSYRRQMERLSRYFNLTLDRLTQTGLDAERRDRFQSARITELATTVQRLRARVSKCEQQGHELMTDKLKSSDWFIWIWPIREVFSVFYLHVIMGAVVQLVLVLCLTKPIQHRLMMNGYGPGNKPSTHKQSNNYNDNNSQQQNSRPISHQDANSIKLSRIRDSSNFSADHLSDEVSPPKRKPPDIINASSSRESFPMLTYIPPHNSICHMTPPLRQISTGVNLFNPPVTPPRFKATVSSNLALSSPRYIVRHLYADTMEPVSAPVETCPDVRSAGETIQRLHLIEPSFKLEDSALNQSKMSSLEGAAVGEIFKKKKKSKKKRHSAALSRCNNCEPADQTQHSLQDKRAASLNRIDFSVTS